MNRFDENYDIRFANYEEIDEIMGYIRDHWKSNHILACNRSFFEYEHVIDGKVNFLIAKSKVTGKIEGILGYIPASKNKQKLDIWGVIWKVNDDAMPMLGMELKKRIMKCTNARSELGVGANLETSIPLLKILFHYQVGQMKHFYMLSDCSEYKIARVSNRSKEKKISEKVTKTVEYKNISELIKEYDFTINESDIPYKDAWYVNHRFFEHPIYQYHVLGLYVEDSVEALLVYREQVYKDSVALRIVDYIGEQSAFEGLGVFFQRLLQRVEYIDFYCSGFERSYIEGAGFRERTNTDTNVIPDHFFPFESKNIDIFVDSSCTGCQFFKADGDQDRPNIGKL